MKILFNKYTLFLFCQLAVFVVLFLKFGISEGSEGPKYIEGSLQLIAGNLNYTQRLPYLSYTVLLAICTLIYSKYLVFAFHIILGFVSAICLDKTLQINLRNKNISTAAALIFIFCYPIQIWALTFYTEYFFICITIISYYLSIKNSLKTNPTLYLFLLLVLTLTRPNGIFIASSFFIYSLSNIHFFIRKHHLKLQLLNTFLLLIMMLSVKLNTNGYTSLILNKTIIDLHNDHTFAPTHKMSIFEAYKILFEKNSYWEIGNLIFQKIISFFTLTRSYYSFVSNSIYALFYILYPLSMLGLYYLKTRNENQVYTLPIINIFTQAIIIGFTYNEWHPRYTIVIFPFLIFLAMFGIKQVFEAKSLHSKNMSKN